jgi:hypothetical protein
MKFEQRGPVIHAIADHGSDYAKVIGAFGHIRE